MEVEAKRPRRSPPPPSPQSSLQTPSATTDEARYDRQLRLWGSEAQALLESAHVCVIGGSALGAEVLKNLVLPGVGQFTLIDATAAAASTASDAASNFFVWPEDVAAGRTRCDAVVARVLELNDRVRGTGRRVASLSQLLDSGGGPAYFRQFSLVVLTQCWDEALTVRLESTLREAGGVPLVVARCVGFWGWVRVSTPARGHCVYDTRRSPPIRDLRIADPFPALAAFASSPRFGAHPDSMDGLSPADHSHVPFPVVLIKALRLWHRQHGEQETAETTPSVGEIRSIVRTQLMMSPDEENITEALTNATKALPFSTYGRALVENVYERVFADERTESPPQQQQGKEKEDSEFWVAAAALKAFYRSTGRLPLPEERLPDMASYTGDYVELQALYNTEAARDRAEVTRLAADVCKRLGRPPLEDSVVAAFCRRAAYLYVARHPTLEDEFRSLSQDTYNCNESSSSATTAETARGIIAAMRVASIFYAKKGRLPGSSSNRNDDDNDSDDAGDDDVQEVKAVRDRFHAEGSDLPLSDGLVAELCRYGGAELHSIAAIVAGVASQEAIKLVTHRFIPLEDTFVYNGTDSTGTQFGVCCKKGKKVVRGDFVN